MGTARLRFPRFHHRAPGERAPLPLSPAAEVIAENVRERCGQLAELDPRAIDLAAMVLAALHEGCRGRMTELRGTSVPEHRRRQLLGRDGLQVEALSYLAIHAPEAVAAALRPLAAEVDHRLEPLEPDETAGVSVAYIARFGNSSWEVDALRPETLAALIRAELGALVDDEAMESICAQERKQVASLERALETLGGPA